MQYLIIAIGVINAFLLIILLLRKNPDNSSELRIEIGNSLKNISDMINETLKNSAQNQDLRIKELNERLGEFTKTTSDNLKSFEQRLNVSTASNEKKMAEIRETVEQRLQKMQEDNNVKLEKMRETVDEKLQKTLEERISKSFRVVSERLEEVYKGLGEMKNLATGVGDLKKVLSNVKTRGILGEIQLGAILEQFLSPEQYDTNVPVKKGSREVVEFAVKLPGTDGNSIYLPIDSKFPVDAYSDLTDAYESGDAAAVEEKKNILKKRIKQFAKDISDKYISPPETTDFALMFLPVEGLYAEVVRSGLLETLQREYKVSVAGPTTVAAFLQSLQMGFKTLAIQKRSSEVFNVLGAVKTEFEKFSDVIKSAQQRLDQANNELEKLVGVRTRQISKKLTSITSLTDEESEKILELDSEFGEDM